MSSNFAAPLLQVHDLCISFGKGRKKCSAVQNVTFDIYPGETFGLVGESGSGKTTIGRSIIRLVPADSGEILYNGEKINGKIRASYDQALTREIQMIFQDPMSSLNERAKVDYIIAEGLLNMGVSLKQRNQAVMRALAEVGLRADFTSRFPHEFSGGQRQRIGIARAMVMEPKLIIADEPISALDVSIRAQVLNVMRRLQQKRGLTYLFISHDLSVMRYICDRIAALYKGMLMELADTETLYSRALHPYTRALLSAIPQPDPIAERGKKLLTYDPATHDYRQEPPEWREIEPGHFVRGNPRELEAYRRRLETLPGSKAL